MSSLQSRVEPIPGVASAAVVRLHGILDQPTLTAFQNQLDAVRNEERTLVILDMSGVSYANSTTLGILVTQADAFRDAGGELVLLKPQPKVDLVIDMLGLSTLFKIFVSEPEARQYVAAFAAAGGPPPEPTTAPAPAPAAAAPTAGFPIRATCIGCAILLEFTQDGHYRCPRCSTAYRVDATGRIAGAKPRGAQPIELSLTCAPGALAAFQHFVGALPRWPSYSDTERERLERAVAEVCSAIHQKAYEGDANGTLHALILHHDDGLTLRLADHGKPLDRSDFPVAAEVMSEFEHRPHPTRGNILKMTKRAG